MPTCAVVGCKNGSGKNEKLKENGEKYILFRYSKTLAKKEWLERLNRKDYVATENTRVCEYHFAEEAFVLDEENKDAKGRKRERRQLKPMAYPTLHLRSPRKSPAKKSRKGKLKQGNEVVSIPTNLIRASEIGLHNYQKLPSENDTKDEIAQSSTSDKIATQEQVGFSSSKYSHLLR